MIQEPIIDIETAKEHGLSNGEYLKILFLSEKLIKIQLRLLIAMSKKHGEFMQF